MKQHPSSASSKKLPPEEIKLLRLGTGRQPYGTVLVDAEDVEAYAHTVETLTGNVTPSRLIVVHAPRLAYGVQGYGRMAAAENNVYAAAEFAETLAGSLTHSTNAILFAQFSATLHSGMSASAGAMIAEPLIEGLGSVLYMTEQHSGAAVMQAQLAGKAYAALDFYFKQAVESGLLGFAHLSADIAAVCLFDEKLNADILVSVHMYVRHSLYETLHGFASVQHIDAYSATIQTDIPPGGVLVIDAEHYNVLLNGESIIAKHDGDWLTISRETLDFTVEAFGGQYEWEVYAVALYV